MASPKGPFQVQSDLIASEFSIHILTFRATELSGTRGVAKTGRVIAWHHEAQGSTLNPT